MPELPEVIDGLFDTFRRPTGKEYSVAEVARWCAQWLAENRDGGTFSPEYVRQLRKGIKRNPTTHHLEALAAFFDVPPSIFFGEEGERMYSDLKQAVALREAGVQDIAMRLARLAPEARREAMAILNQVLDFHQSGSAGGPPSPS